jgi:16S rRNA (adenine1518-N6/adenine1519-N6)-dimethyltransferase
MVVDAAQIDPQEVVLEIGPGLGSLTCYLAARARLVVAVELDTRLIPPLVQVLGQFPNVRLVQGDILALDPMALVSSQEYLVVANIPYYITSSLIRHLLEAQVTPSRMILTVQQEVARRICALPGEMSLLALSVQVYGSPRLLAHIPAGAFTTPNVDSGAHRLVSYLIPVSQLDAFSSSRAGFSQKRKTLQCPPPGCVYHHHRSRHCCSHHTRPDAGQKPWTSQNGASCGCYPILPS